jgi:hypothetical protein
MPTSFGTLDRLNVVDSLPMDDFGDEEREAYARGDGVQVWRPRRSPPRLPAGTMRVTGNGGGGCIPIVSGAWMTELEIGLFRMIQGEVMNPIRFGIVEHRPVTDDHREALRRITQAAFDCESEDALWLVPFLGEIEAARGERLVLESREADPSTTNLIPLAEVVIGLARRRAQRLAPSIDMPPWLSPQVTALLLKRFSYSGGGGPYAALTPDSIRRLLADPRRLRKYLNESPERARLFHAELAALDAAIAASPNPDVVPKPARPDLIDQEHATPSERRDAREAANRPSWIAKVPASWIVGSESGFVGIRFNAR